MQEISGRIQLLREALQKGKCAGPIRFFRAPGRVNVMGDHTDYNEGFVLPIAMDLDCVVAATLNDGPTRIRSLDFGGEGVEIPVDAHPFEIEPEWARPFAGVIHELRDLGHEVIPIDAAISSTVPAGSGLSSSAAAEVSFALALLDFSSISLDSAEIAQLCQRAEQIATGVPCGIMDQLTATSSRIGFASLIDCRSLAIEYIPIPDELAVVAVHCGKPRVLSDSQYAERRKECEVLAAGLGLRSLRDANAEQVESNPYGRHVVSENARVLDTANALKLGETSRLGELFADSHASLRDDYRVSTPELDALVDALNEAGAIGSRLTGAGFGGCVVAVTEKDAVDVVVDYALKVYQAKTHLEPTAFVCNAAQAAGPLPPFE